MRFERCVHRRLISLAAAWLSYAVALSSAGAIVTVLAAPAGAAADAPGRTALGAAAAGTGVRRR
jgi:hypothetical protein